MRIKKLVVLFLSILELLMCVSCGGEEKKKLEAEPQISQMKSICELAVMECYYHNVAKYLEKDASGFWLWKKDKHFWIEYSGVVELGIDASLVRMDLNGDTVTITIPEARVLNCTVDSASLTEDSFIVAEKSAKITAEDERIAFAEAQSNMETSAANNWLLLNSAQQRAQALLENYVKNLGDTTEKNYSIQWIFVDAYGNPPGTSISIPSSEPEANDAEEDET